MEVSQKCSIFFQKYTHCPLAASCAGELVQLKNGARGGHTHHNGFIPIFVGVVISASVFKMK